MNYRSPLGILFLSVCFVADAYGWSGPPEKPILSIPLPAGQSSFIVPRDRVKLALNKLFDEDGNSLTAEFFEGKKKLKTTTSANAREYYLVEPLDGEHRITAKVSDGKGHTVESNLVYASFVDLLEIEQNAPQSNPKPNTSIQTFKTATEQKNLVILPQGVSRGTLTFNVKATAVSDRIRALRVFEQGKNKRGKTLQYGLLPGQGVVETTETISFDDVESGVHVFVARAIDSRGTLSAPKELLVMVAGNEAKQTRTDSGASTPKWGSPQVPSRESIADLYDVVHGKVSSRIKKVTPATGGSPRITPPRKTKK